MANGFATRQAERQARFAEAFMNGEHRAAGNFRDIGARVNHDGHYRRGEGVNAQIAKGHRQRKVDEHNLHHNRGAANDFNKHQRDVVGDPAAEAAGETGHQTDDQAAGQAEDGNPQRHFGAFQQNRNGGPDGTPVKLHNTFLLPCREQRKASAKIRSPAASVPEDRCDVAGPAPGEGHFYYFGSVPNHFL